MNDVMITQMMPQTGSVSGVGSYREMEAGKMEAGLAGGIFSEILARLAGAGEEPENAIGMDAETDLNALIQTLLEGAGEEEEENEALMEMIAEMFFGISPALQMQFRQAAGVDSGSDLAEVLSQINPSGTSETELLELQNELLKEVEVVDTDFSMILEENEQSVDLQNPELEILGLSQEGTETTFEKERFELENALREIRENLETQEIKPVSEEEINVEVLQAQVTANQFILRPENAQNILESIAPEEIVSQLSAGILDNIELGLGEFAIKLKPEGLGEIVVKIQQKEDKMVMSILTSTQQVARALSTELESLQTSLKPFQTEIAEIAVNPDFSSYDQNAFGDQGNQSQMRQEQSTWGGKSYQNDSLENAFEPAMSAVLSTGSLDAYV